MKSIRTISSCVMKRLPDRLFLMVKYFYHFHRFPNLKNPHTFNEKLQWLKLYDRRAEYTIMVDKYEAKRYVASIIGEEYIIPTIGVWYSVDEIDWDSLPNQFVLKWNDDSGSIVICKDKTKFNINEAVRVLRTNDHDSGYWYGREWPYKNVRPCIIAEKYMVDESGTELKDFKFFCFNGVAKMFKIDFGRFVEHHANYYSCEGDILPFGEKNIPPIYDKVFHLPHNLSEMLSLAEKISNGISFVRVDFYNIRGRIYFGEITFYPASGFELFTSNEWDKRLGEWLELPTINNK